ncbi:hypothetical protein VULLAG_LOCUS21819 [Vulpes lagopus]
MSLALCSLGHVAPLGCDGITRRVCSPTRMRPALRTVGCRLLCGRHRASYAAGLVGLVPLVAFPEPIRAPACLRSMVETGLHSTGHKRFVPGERHVT